jgi:hypothetical protein
LSFLSPPRRLILLKKCLSGTSSKLVGGKETVFFRWVSTLSCAISESFVIDFLPVGRFRQKLAELLGLFVSFFDFSFKPFHVLG